MDEDESPGDGGFKETASKSRYLGGTGRTSPAIGESRADQPSVARHVPSVPELVAVVADEEMAAELTNVEVEVHVREVVDADVRASGLAEGDFVASNELVARIVAMISERAEACPPDAAPTPRQPRPAGR